MAPQHICSLPSVSFTAMAMTRLIATDPTYNTQCGWMEPLFPTRPTHPFPSKPRLLTCTVPALSVRTASGRFTGNLAPALSSGMIWLQMVEQFEDRVEASVAELRKQLSTALQEVGACKGRLDEVAAATPPPLEAEQVAALWERTEGLERRLETVQAGTSGSSASAAVRPLDAVHRGAGGLGELAEQCIPGMPPYCQHVQHSVGICTRHGFKVSTVPLASVELLLCIDWREAGMRCMSLAVMGRRRTRGSHIMQE